MLSKDIPILYQNEGVLVVYKPAGLLTAPTSTEENSLQSLLASDDPKTHFPIALTRLDRGVSGVTVLAKHAKSASFMTSVLSDHTQFLKEYRAIICGSPKEREGMWQDLLWHDASRNKTFVVTRMRRGVKEASLSYRVLQTVVCDEKEYSLMAITLHTGRTHQIRVQCSSRHFPLLGDGKYGGGNNRVSHPALHAYRVTFPTPAGEQISCTAPLPTEYPWNLFNHKVE